MAQVCVSIDKFDTQPQSVVLKVNRIRLVCFDFQSVISRNILSVNEKLPVSQFRYFGKYIMQLFRYCYVHVSGQ